MADKIRDLLASLQAGLGELQSEVDRVLPAPSVVTNVVRVKPGDDLAAAINSLSAGGTILGQPGDYKMNARLEPRFGGNLLITVKTDTANLPPDGKRISRDAVSGLMRLSSANGIDPIFKPMPNSGGICFSGVAFMPLQYDRTQVELGGDSKELSDVSQRAENFAFDRCLFLGDPQRGQHRGITANAKKIMVRACAFHDLHEQGRDSQAIAGWNGTDTLVIENCHLEAGAENVIIGGADSASIDLSPRNVKIVGSRFVKPASWQTLTAHPPAIKALFELKNIRGFYMAGCLLEQNWKRDWSSGVAITLKSCNGDNGEPWATLEDVIIEDCVIRNVGSVFNIIGWNDGLKSSGTQYGRGVTLKNILAYGLNKGSFLGDGRGIMFINAVPHNMTIDHVTMVDRQANSFMNFGLAASAPGGGRGEGFVFTNNVVEEGEYAITSPNANGYAAVTTSTKSNMFTGNAIRKGARTYTYPPGNAVVPATTFDAGFDTTGLVAGNAIATSPGLRTTDGKKPGADLDAIKLRLADPL